MWKFALVYLTTLGGLLVADAVSEVSAITGGTGWVGASILGGVLAWLMFVHLPAKDKMFKELINDKDKQIDVILTSKWEALKQIAMEHTKVIESLSAKYQLTMDKVIAHCDVEVQRIIGVFDRDREERDKKE